MWPYLTLWSAIALPALVKPQGRVFGGIAAFYFLVLLWFVGLRHHVGMDWNNYLRMIDEASRLPDWTHLNEVSEPFYALLLVFGDWSGLGIYVVNFLATTAILIGLFSFVRRTPEPWIALMVALPIFLLVVGMSANRQALAAGMLMLLVANWYRWSLKAKVLFILFCSGFHASAILYLGFVGLDLKLARPLKLIGLFVFLVLGYFLLQQTGRIDYYDAAYVSGRSAVTESSGAFMHASLNAVPAALYFLLPRYRHVLFPNTIIRNIAFAALAILPVVFFSSAAGGRVSLYFFPVSIWVLSALPSVVAPLVAPLVRIGICLAMLAILVVYLTLGNSALAHIPYNNATLVQAHELEIGVVP